MGEGLKVIITIHCYIDLCCYACMESVIVNFCYDDY